LVAANEATGKTKAAAGRTTDNPELVLKGIAQQGKGWAWSLQAARASTQRNEVPAVPWATA